VQHHAQDAVDAESAYLKPSSFTRFTGVQTLTS
jgi:hypothetical protein